MKKWDSSYLRRVEVGGEHDDGEGQHVRRVRRGKHALKMEERADLKIAKCTPA